MPSQSARASQEDSFRGLNVAGLLRRIHLAVTARALQPTSAGTQRTFQPLGNKQGKQNTAFFLGFKSNREAAPPPGPRPRPWSRPRARLFVYTKEEGEVAAEENVSVNYNVPAVSGSWLLRMRSDYSCSCWRMKFERCSFPKQLNANARCSRLLPDIKAWQFSPTLIKFTFRSHVRAPPLPWQLLMGPQPFNICVGRQVRV